MRTMAILLGGLLIFGTVLPVAAENVDYGNGVKWDTTRLEQAKQSTAPADAEYHRASEPGKHIPPEAARPVYPPGTKPASLGHEYDPRMHSSGSQ